MSLVMASRGGGVPEVPWASAYKPQEIAALWSTAVKVYGSDAAARQAVSQNDQIICPVYATPQLLSQSHASLVGLLGKEEALEIMMKNPAVLTCGAKELAASDPGEIRSAANARKVLDGITAEGLTVALLAALALFVAKLAAAQ